MSGLAERIAALPTGDQARLKAMLARLERMTRLQTNSRHVSSGDLRAMDAELALLRRVLGREA